MSSDVTETETDTDRLVDVEITEQLNKKRKCYITNFQGTNYQNNTKTQKLLKIEFIQTQKNRFWQKSVNASHPQNQSINIIDNSYFYLFKVIF